MSTDPRCPYAPAPCGAGRGGARHRLASRPVASLWEPEAAAPASECGAQKAAPAPCETGQMPRMRRALRNR